MIPTADAGDGKVRWPGFDGPKRCIWTREIGIRIIRVAHRLRMCMKPGMLHNIGLHRERDVIVSYSLADDGDRRDDVGCSALVPRLRATKVSLSSSICYIIES